MAYFAVNYDKTEFIYEFLPWQANPVFGERWYQKEINGKPSRCRRLRQGTIEKLIGHKMCFNTKPIEYERDLAWEQILADFEKQGYLVMTN